MKAALAISSRYKKPPTLANQRLFLKLVVMGGIEPPTYGL